MNKRAFLILMSIFVLSFNILSVDYSNYSIDELEQILLKTKDIKQKIQILIELSGKYINSEEYEKSLRTAKLLLNLANKLNDEKSIGKAYENIADYYLNQDNYEKAKKYFLKAGKIFKSMEDKESLAYVYQQLGAIHYLLSEHKSAILNLQKSLKIYISIGKTSYISDIADIYNMLGNIYFETGKRDKSLEFLFKTLKLLRNIDSPIKVDTYLTISYVYQENKDYKKMLEFLNLAEELAIKKKYYNSLSDVYVAKAMYYENIKKFENAIDYYKKALRIYENQENKLATAGILNNMGEIYRKLNNFYKAKLLYKKALKIYKEINNEIGQAVCLNNLAMVSASKKDYKKALDLLNRSKKLAIQSENTNLLKEIYFNYSNFYENIRNFKKALYYFKNYFKVNEKLLNEKKLKDIAEMQTKYETEKKQREIQELKREKLEKELDIEKQKRIKNITFIAGLSILLIAGLIYNRYRIKTKANKELSKANKIIYEKNQKITKSIEYAKLIQNAILPSNNLMESVFKEHFVIYLPKDIVSGDFYWLKEVNNNVFFAVSDCTGHGVPGAFMSMIGNTILNQIVNLNSNILPSKLLEILHLRIQDSLKQHDDHAPYDGMDIGIVRFNKLTNKLIFAGAKRPLYLNKKKDNSYEFMEIKGDRKSIGGIQKEEKRIFYDKEIELKNDDIFYLSSDGFGDQNNEHNKKFGTKRIKGLLSKIATKHLIEQKNILLKELLKHKGSQEQRDDITLVGFKII